MLATHKMSLTPSCYINVADLNECLIHYFQGTLDHVPLLDRLYRAPRELHPTNSLYGLLEAQDLYNALDTLTPLQKALIAQEYAPSEESENYITQTFVLSGSNRELWQWQSEQLTEAFTELAKAVLRIL